MKAIEFFKSGDCDKCPFKDRCSIYSPNPSNYGVDPFCSALSKENLEMEMEDLESEVYGWDLKNEEREERRFKKEQDRLDKLNKIKENRRKNYILCLEENIKIKDYNKSIKRIRKYIFGIEGLIGLGEAFSFANSAYKIDDTSNIKTKTKWQESKEKLQDDIELYEQKINDLKIIIKQKIKQNKLNPKLNKRSE